MQKVLTLAAVAALALGQVSAVQAMDLSVAIGQTGESTMTYRLGAQFDCSVQFIADPTAPKPQARRVSAGRHGY